MALSTIPLTRPSPGSDVVRRRPLRMAFKGSNLAAIFLSNAEFLGRFGRPQGVFNLGTVLIKAGRRLAGDEVGVESLLSFVSN